MPASLPSMSPYPERRPLATFSEPRRKSRAPLTIAALLEGLVRPAGPTVAVLSGGNIEWAGLLALLGDA